MRTTLVTDVIGYAFNRPALPGIEGYGEAGPVGGGSFLVGSAGVVGPFRGHKLSLYEGGHRIPFIITGPGVDAGTLNNDYRSTFSPCPTA